MDNNNFVTEYENKNISDDEFFNNNLPIFNGKNFYSLVGFLFKENKKELLEPRKELLKELRDKVMEFKEIQRKASTDTVECQSQLSTNLLVNL